MDFLVSAGTVQVQSRGAGGVRLDGADCPSLGSRGPLPQRGPLPRPVHIPQPGGRLQGILRRQRPVRGLLR